MIREVVQILRDLFHGFETGKVSGGDSWEALFVISAIARVATNHFCSLLPLDTVVFANCRVSYNCFWEQTHDGASFLNITTIEQLIEGLTRPPSYPHVAVFYPPHARFETYDLVVVAYQQADVRQVYGYQLKEGRVIPEEGRQTVSASIRMWSGDLQQRGKSCYAAGRLQATRTSTSFLESVAHVWRQSSGDRWIQRVYEEAKG